VTTDSNALEAERADTRSSGENPMKTIATVIAILVAGAAVSLSVLHASSVEHRDAQAQQQAARTQEGILKDMRSIECGTSSYCTKF